MANQYPAGVGNTTRTKGAYEFNIAMFGTLPVSVASTFIFTTPASGSDPVETSTSGTTTGVFVWYSERLAADYALLLSDTLSLAISAYWTAANPNATIRATLSKVTSGGVETEFATVDGATAKDNVVSKDTYTFTILRALDFGVGERILMRIWAIPPAGQQFTAGDLRIQAGASSAGNGQAILNLPAGMTFIPVRTTLHFRDAASALGGTWKQLDTTKGAAAVQAIVQTANVSEKQWTVTSGGALIEWISKRFSRSWRFESTGLANVNAISVVIFVAESATSANAGARVRVYRRRGTTETEVFSVEQNAEMGTTMGTITFNDTGTGSSPQTGMVLTPADFHPDDRLVARLFIVPKGGAMPSSQTATFQYDAASGTGLAWVQLFDSSGFKEESDADEPPYQPGTLSQTGMGS